MNSILTQIQDWLTAGGPPMSAVEWLLLLMLLLAATVILNIVTHASEPSRMLGNFVSLLMGAGLGNTLLHDWLPGIYPAASFALAIFSGMAVAALVNIVLFKPA